MNKCIKSILLFCLLITISCIPILNVSASSTVYTYEGYSYTLEDNNNAYICGWDNSTDTLVIPSKLDGNDVFGISNFAFQNNTYLTAVNFTGADYLKSIGMMAFCGCTGLSGNITVPGGVTAVSLGAFQECTSIEFFDYRANTIAIPAQCCYNCSSLKRVNIADGVQRIDSFAFANCYLLEYIKIPISVTSINGNAFTNCRNLVIYCYTGSYAQQYAEDKGIDYVLIDAPTPTEPPTEEPTIAPTEEPTTASTEAPTLEPTEAPTEAVVPILGDADGNGVIEVDDATYIQRVIAELPVPFAMETLMHGDVDGDGELTIADATLIQRYNAEMPVNYPIGAPITE